MKKLIILLLIPLLLCSCTSAPEQPTSSVEEITVADWEYEFYIEDVNENMVKYVDALDKVTAANNDMDLAALEEAYNECIDILECFRDIRYPATLSEKHNTMLSVIDLELEGYEIILSLLYYVENEAGLTSEEQSQMVELQSKLENNYNELENNISLWDARTAALNEAWSYLE